jgi:formylglycine-generating enzyme required for sulfatase activity
MSVRRQSVEVARWTLFTDCFTHLRSGETVADPRVLMASLLADGLNLGLTRIAGLREPSAYVEVPAGNYPYGERRFEIGTPFRIGRYPVTNSQYQDFIDDGGYRERTRWSGAGWDWQQESGLTEPALWPRPNIRVMRGQTEPGMAALSQIAHYSEFLGLRRRP